MEDKGKQLWQSLNAIFACSVCNKRLAGFLYVCGSGHTICNVCTVEKKICTQCHSPYTEIPNLLVQNLLSQFDNLKVYMKELYDKKKKYEESLAVTEEKDDDKSSNGKTVKYRCWITDCCDFSGDISTIVEHFKNKHADQFEEHLNRDFPYTKAYQVDYGVGKNLDHAIKIGGQIFIIHISINNMGELGVCVIMYNNKEIAAKYGCQVEIGTGRNKLYFMNAQVITARAFGHTTRELKRGGLHIVYNKILYERFRENNRFSCTVSVQEKDKFVGKIKNFAQKSHEKNININDFAIVNNYEIIEINQQLNVENIHGDNSSIVAANESNDEDRECN